MKKAINNIVVRFIPFLFLLCFSLSGFSQANPIDKRMSLSVSNEPMEKVLATISQITSVRFSYNSDIIPLDSLVSLNCTNVPVSTILNQIVGKRCTFKTMGNHIIFLKKTVKKREKTPQVNDVIKGQVFDFETNRKMANVSVIDMTTQRVTLTDSNGFYSLTLPSKAASMALLYSKEKYDDTIVMLGNKPVSIIAIQLHSKPRPIETYDKLEPKRILFVTTNDITAYGLVQAFVNVDMVTHSKNIAFQEKRIAQFSLLPYLGTNSRISGSIINHFSVNAVAGYSNGLSGFEIGTVLNISKRNVNGVQMAGFGNITGGNTKAFQIASVFNQTVGNATGMQMAGFSNVVLDTLKGVQIGALNFAKINKGFQLGIINVVDSSDGVSIGFVSIVRKGYYNLSFYPDEMLMANLTFKMGAHTFYNIWGLSANTEMWGLTYGVGIHSHPEKKISFNYDLSFTNVSYKKAFEIQVCLKTKFSTDLNYSITSNVDLFAGLSYNIFSSDKITDLALQEYVSKITKSYILETQFKSVKMQLWPGAQLGLKWRM
jgi:hypothetical protein